MPLKYRCPRCSSQHPRKKPGASGVHHRSSASSKGSRNPCGLTLPPRKMIRLWGEKPRLPLDSVCTTHTPRTASAPHCGRRTLRIGFKPSVTAMLIVRYIQEVLYFQVVKRGFAKLGRVPGRRDAFQREIWVNWFGTASGDLAPFGSYGIGAAQRDEQAAEFGAIFETHSDSLEAGLL
jgi:hypothetical protein